MPKRKSCTSRDGAWPIESGLFEYRFQNQSENRTSSSCELFDQTITLCLHHTTFDLDNSPTVSLYCFISVAVSLNRADGETCKVGSISRSTLIPARLLKLLLLQGR